MKSEVDRTPATEASVWEGLRDTGRFIKESYAMFKQEMAESRAEFDRLRKESDDKFNREMAESRAESDRLRKESEARFNREMAESRTESDRLRKESEARFSREMAESRAEFDKRMKELNEQIGGMSNSDGLFAEEYFFNAFEQGQQSFFGETFDDIKRNVKSIVVGCRDQYDIVMLNGKSVGIVEVKYRARLDDIPKVINKANTFRGNFPGFENHQVYLALATLVFNERLEDECIKNGIAIVKQVGDTVVINDAHLKVY